MDRTGWTLEYVDSLELAESYRMIQTWQNADAAHAHNRKQAQKKAQRRKGR